MAVFKLGATFSKVQSDTRKNSTGNSPRSHLLGAGFNRLFQASMNRYLSTGSGRGLECKKKIFHRMLNDLCGPGTADKIFKEDILKDGGLYNAGKTADSVFGGNDTDSDSQGEVRKLNSWNDLRLGNQDNDDISFSQEEDLSVEFPPFHAPEKVKKAWNKTMAALDAKEQFAALYLFMAQSIIANLRVDDDCEIKGLSCPGDPDYKNIFSSELGEWADLLEEIDAYLEIEQEDFSQKKERIDMTKQPPTEVGGFKSSAESTDTGRKTRY